MLDNPTLAAVATALTVAFAATTATAQNVLLSEVGTDSRGGWVELYNRGTTAADLTGFSLYLATATPNQPQTYWWGFRAGTAVPAGGYLIVRWLQPVPSVPVAGEVATGSSPYDFLFSLGSEQLPLARGALALLRSQRNVDMNDPAMFADWVSWGQGSLSRESIAAQAGVWTAGHAAPSVPSIGSLARHPGVAINGQPEASWFVDATPTPGADNVGPAAIASLGTPCAPIGHHLLGLPTLTTTSMAVLGNGTFGLRVSNTTGVYLEHCVLALATASTPGVTGLLAPAPGDAGCLVRLDPSSIFATVTVHTNVVATTMPMSLANLPASLTGMQFFAQALVYDELATAWPPYQGLTNALAITIGN